MSRPMHVLTGPRVPESTWSPFLCEHFHGTLTGGECLRRQTKRVKAAGNWADKSPRVPPHLEFCASGKCEQGLEIAKAFPTWKPEDRPRPDWSRQMAAKREAEAAAPPLRGLAPRPAPVAETVEQLKRECADIALSMKKPSWSEFKAQKDRERGQEPQQDPLEIEPHPLSNRGLEKQMAEPIVEADRTCNEPGCARTLRSDNTSGLCRDHANKIHQRNYQARKTGKPSAHKPRAAAIQALTRQDEFDTMIRIRDDFRRLSTAWRRYVLDALKAAR